MISRLCGDYFAAVFFVCLAEVGFESPYHMLRCSLGSPFLTCDGEDAVPSMVREPVRIATVLVIGSPPSVANLKQNLSYSKRLSMGVGGDQHREAA